MKRIKSNRSRRDFLRKTGAGTVVVTLGGLLASRVSLAGSHLPKLDLNDPTAKSLEYTHESKVDGQRCNNCQLWQGGDNAWGGCAIFPGKEVSAKGWCKSWVIKSG